MKFSRLLPLLATLTVAATTSCSQRAPSVTVDFASCVSALTNIAGFAETPLGEPHMVSSYDRTGGNNDWDTMPAPDKDGLYPIAFIKGPGCLKRLWHTSIDADHWFFFFDGEREARIVATRDELFGGRAPFEPPLAAQVSGGYYSYVPLPFEKSLRIAVSFRKGLTGFKSYYQANYETYDQSVRVVSFPKELSAETKQQLARTRAAWSSTQTDAERMLSSCAATNSGVLAPGATITWLQHDGPGTLSSFWLRWQDPANPSALERARRLRELTLRIFWDGAAEPSVEVPVGDFFCNGPFRRRFASLPLAVTDDAMVCRFPMPFSRSARAELRNDGQTPVTVGWGYDLQPRQKDDGKANYFHARWTSSINGGRPHTVLSAKGGGHFVGCYLIATGTDGSWNILESDDNTFLNGETMPSMNGTGLEDCFNGAWYYDGIFNLPFHGLIERAAMRTTQYRFYLSDAVAFKNGFHMNFEFGHGNQSQGYMSSIAYWYQTEPYPAGTVLPPVASGRFPPADRLEASAIMAGLIELEHAGFHKEAAERCDLYAEKFASTPFAPLLKLRAAANREFADGFNAVRDAYQSIAADQTTQEASQQARMLLWYHASPSNALLAAHTSMRIKGYLDGMPTLEGALPTAATPFVAAVTPGKGAHEITAEVTPLGSPSWISFCLKTHSTNITSDGTWEYSLTRPSDWPATTDSTIAWKKVEHSSGGLPKMGFWQFMPNGYVGLQIKTHLIEYAWSGWGAAPFKTTYLRKHFSLTE